MTYLSRIVLVGLAICIAGQAQALDVDNYRKLAKATIKQMDMGVVGDIDSVIATQEQLMALGAEGGVEYLKDNPKGGMPLQLVIVNAEKMKDLSLAGIEAQWHDGGFLKANGIDPEQIDHFGPLMSLMDSVIHPATSYLLLNEYKKTGDRDLLVRVKAELFEVLEHINNVYPEAGVQLSAN